MRTGRPLAGRFELVRELGRGGMGEVYEAIDRDTAAVVALKLLGKADAELLFRFKREFRDLTAIEHPHIVRLGELYCEDDRWFFTMELVRGRDFLAYVRGAQGERLKATGTDSTQSDGEGPDDTELIGRMPDVASAPELPVQKQMGGFVEPLLREALPQLASALHALHLHGRVHRDVKPSNVLVREDGHLVLLDFGLVESIGAARPRFERDKLYGTPQFMAPEQVEGEDTGPAADWYAFGVMLFMALTGTLPFRCHVDAVLKYKRLHDAPRPSELALDVPDDLDALCAALLSRDPIKRPTGDHVLRVLSADGRLSAPQPMRDEPKPVFVGRRAELAQLARAREQAEQGKRALWLVEGEPGLGKSALVSAFFAGLTRRGEPPIVLSGRCYEQESLPFKAFDSLVDTLVSQLGGLPEVELARVLGGGVRALSAVFPVLRRVPLVARLSGELRAQTALLPLREQAFHELAELLGRMSRRALVVVFIDDLQWADAPSLSLLEALLESRSAQRCLFLATRRTPSQAFSEELARLNVERITLAGLSVEESRVLWGQLAPSIPVRTRARAQELEELLLEAQGHPLFLSELARAPQGAANDVGGKDHLVHVLARRIRALDLPLQRFLHMAALCGAPTPYQVLARAAEIDAGEAMSLLGSLVNVQLVRMSRREQERLIEPYHDRIREALLDQLAGDQARGEQRVSELQLKLGRALLELTPPERLPSAVFAIVRHLNAARAHLASDDERLRLAELNLLAGKEARLATAYHEALDYLESASSLLPSDPWRAAAALMRTIQAERIKASYLAGDRDVACALFEQALSELPNAEEQTALYADLIALETGAGRSHEAIALARRGLYALGECLPGKGSKLGIVREYLGARFAQRGRDALALSDLPRMEHVAKRCATMLIVAMSPAAFFVSSELLVMVLLRIARLSMRYGVTEESAYGFGGYGMVLAGAFARYDEAHALGELAHRLQRRFGSNEFASKIPFVTGTYVTAWKRPYARAIAELAQALELAAQVGDTAYEGYAAGTHTILHYCESKDLRRCEEVAHAALAVAQRCRDLDMTSVVECHARYCRALRSGAALLGEDADDEARLGASLSVEKNPVALFYFHFLRAQLAYFAGDGARAAACFALSEPHVGAIMSVPTSAQFELFRVLIQASPPAQGVLARAGRAAKLLRAERRLQRWARACPENFAAVHALARAVRVPPRASKLRIARLESALELARRHEQPALEVLALTLLAREPAHGQPDVHAQAAEAYARWGAVRALRDASAIAGAPASQP